MKKDIEWAQKEVDRYLSYEGVNEARNALVFAKGVINQMDEPEVTHEQVVEWIENNEFYCHATAETVLEIAIDKGELGYYGTKYSVVEKPVIPRYVAEWIEKAKRYHSISWLLNYQNIEGWSHELALWCFESGNEDNLHKLARAWLDGYVVEEEQKYYVLDSDDIPLLERVDNQVQKTITRLSIYEKGRDTSRIKLTEQEIKNYDERFWVFAERVEQADFRLSF